MRRTLSLSHQVHIQIIFGTLSADNSVNISLCPSNHVLLGSEKWEEETSRVTWLPHSNFFVSPRSPPVTKYNSTGDPIHRESPKGARQERRWQWPSDTYPSLLLPFSIPSLQGLPLCHRLWLLFNSHPPDSVNCKVAGSGLSLSIPDSDAAASSRAVDFVQVQAIVSGCQELQEACTASVILCSPLGVNW